MEKIEMEKNVVEIYNKAYELCLNCKFQESYNLIKDIAKDYDIPFYAVLCLNLEQYGYYKHLNKSNLRKIEDAGIISIDDDFKKVCEKAKRACEVAYDFCYDMVMKGIFCEDDPNATVNLTELQENIFAANYFASQAVSDNELYASATWGLTRKYIIKALMLFSGDASIWNSFAKTFFEQKLDEEYMKGYIAIKRAQEIEEEYLNESSEPWNVIDFDLHYTLLRYLVLLKEYGLEQHWDIKREVKILEKSKRTPEENYKLEQLKKDIINAERNSNFCNENISYTSFIKEEKNQHQNDIVTDITNNTSFIDSSIDSFIKQVENEKRELNKTTIWFILGIIGVILFFILMYATEGFGASDWTTY